ncbi:MAG: hypothetical protein D6794_09235 [Deltaproteobacteria bacterium]|nr:MAG: hypothetical protein D6794_09235 [Deltaproteobacteria bacterium]
MPLAADLQPRPHKLAASELALLRGEPVPEGKPLMRPVEPDTQAQFMSIVERFVGEGWSLRALSLAAGMSENWLTHYVRKVRDGRAVQCYVEDAIDLLREVEAEAA